LKVETPATASSSKSVAPSTSNLVPTARVVPLKVRFASSSSSPEPPTITTLLSVKSEIFAEDATNPAPPEILAPPLPSIIPLNVDAAETTIVLLFV